MPVVWHETKPPTSPTDSEYLKGHTNTIGKTRNIMFSVQMIIEKRVDSNLIIFELHSL